MTKIWLNKRDEEEEEEEAAKIERGISAMKIDGNSKTLYICSFEQNQTMDKSRNWGAYAVRAADLSNLNTKLELRQVGYRAGEDLPPNGGCGVLGSRIVFASGLIPGVSPWPWGPEGSTRAYVMDTNDPKHEIVDMDASLHEGKNLPLTMEVGGKLYVLSAKWYGLPLNSFEVFDPVRRKWSLLPEFPNCGHFLSCAIAGTKLFVSNEKSPTVYCLDLAHPTQWRRVPSMCGGGPFSFSGKALVLDTEHHDKKIVFGGGQGSRVLVYLMSLNEETITPIHELKLPADQLPPWEPSRLTSPRVSTSNSSLLTSWNTVPTPPLFLSLAHSVPFCFSYS
ncbi:hypothetical protein ACLB2K_068574 [Fragaria x ananassa]